MHFLFVCYLLAACTRAWSDAAKIDYSRHSVIRAAIKQEQLDKLAKLQPEPLDIWSFSTINGFADIRLSPDRYEGAIRLLNEMEVQHKIFIADVGELERREQQGILLRRALHNEKAFDFENFHPYDHVMEHIAELVASNSIVSSRVGGLTGEGREIVQVIISSNRTANRPVIFLDCNAHAREWISAAVCMYVIEQLATGYGSNPEATSMVDRYDWKIVPIVNADGYSYTWTDDRLWRKNRAVNDDGPTGCRGVDINRNFPAGYGNDDGSSSDPCVFSYRGKYPLSELETQALANLIASDRGNVKAAISLHCYDQVWMSPYGYTNTTPTDYAEMERVSSLAVQAATATNGALYRFGTFFEIMYTGSGVTTDHYYGNEGILHSYTIELRDTGTYGFVLPPEQILPTGQEIWNAFKVLANAI